MRVAQHHEIVGNSNFNGGERFDEADRLVRERFQALSSQGIIVGAFPFGSTQFADHNAFSDFDIAVAIEETGVEAETVTYRAIHDTAKAVFRRTSVPLEVSCYTTAQLREGLHDFPPTMLSWLKEERAKYPHSVIGDDFIEEITPKRLRQSPRVLADIDEYVARSRHLLKKSWWQGCYFRPHDLLAVVLNTPHIAGRKVIDTLQSNCFGYDNPLQDMKKESITRAVGEMFGPQSEITTLYHAVHSDALRYQREFVNEAVHLSQEEYDQIIEATLDDDLPKVIEFLRRIQQEYRKIYNQSGQIEFADEQTYVEKGSNLTSEGIHDQYVNALRAAQINSY